MLKRAVLKHVVETGNVNQAFRLASDEVFAAVQDRVAAGESLESTLASVGLENPDEVVNQIRELGGWRSANFHVVITGGRLRNVPHPACIEEQLKKYPKPTSEQIQQAYEACRKVTTGIK